MRYRLFEQTKNFFSSSSKAVLALLLWSSRAAIRRKVRLTSWDLISLSTLPPSEIPIFPETEVMTSFSTMHDAVDYTAGMRQPEVDGRDIVAAIPSSNGASVEENYAAYKAKYVVFYT